MSIAKRFVARRGVRQFLKFSIVGFSGMLVSFVLFHLLVNVMPKQVAFGIGFIVGGVNNHFWNRRWTFRSRAHPWRELAQFLTVSAVALVISELALSYAEAKLPHALPFRNSILWAISTAVGVFWNFFANKYWTFRHTQRDVPATQAGQQV